MKRVVNENKIMKAIRRKVIVPSIKNGNLRDYKKPKKNKVIKKYFITNKENHVKNVGDK